MFLVVSVLLVDKNGSFDLSEGLASCVWAKANPPAGRAGVPLWVGNCFKKCAVGKK